MGIQRQAHSQAVLSCYAEGKENDPVTLQQSGPSRRTLVKGAAWSVPVVAVAGAAPAMAASPDIIHSHITQWRWYSNGAPWCSGNGDGLEINTTDASAFVRFTDTRSWTTITDVYAYFWFRKPDMTWTSATGNSGCWTAPSYDETTDSANGRTYYRYRSDYICPITPAHMGTTVLQPYRWQSPCYYEGDWEYMRWARRQAFATVNGVPQPTDTSYFRIES